MTTYSVRVLRVYEESYVDVDVDAHTKKEAAAKAIEEAQVNGDILFDDTPEPRYIVDPTMDPEKIT